MIKIITEKNFNEEVMLSEVPVLVDLWAPWCVHCRRLSPVLDRLAEKYGDRLKIGKVNVDENPSLASSLNVEMIPSLFLYKDGEHGEKLVAPSSQAQLEDWIELQL